jgi:hypothetical protein
MHVMCVKPVTSGKYGMKIAAWFAPVSPPNQVPP